MGAAINRLMGKYEEFKALPGGEAFTIEVTDKEATAAAKEYITENKQQIRSLLKEKTGFSLDVDDPRIQFGNDELRLSATGGKGFIKSKASLIADVKWNGRPVVFVREVKLPVVSVSPEKLNSTAEEPLRKFTDMIGEYAEIRSFKLKNGVAVLEAVKR